MITSTFTETLQAEVAALQTAHPLLKGALDRAFHLVVSGDLFPLPDGRSAHVRSQSDPDTAYLVNGTCDCLSAQYRKEPCVHRYALRLYQKAVERLTVDPEEERWEPVDVPAPVSPAAPLPEAPASVNVRLTIDGREVQLTLRDTDETRLLQRLAAVLAQYPVPLSPPAPSQGQGEGWCLVHDTSMKWNDGKDGRTGWYSHKTADGWCKGRK